MYQAQITRAHKGAIVILIDRSGSMAEETLFEGRTISKAEALSDVTNLLIEEIINYSHRDRYIGDYFDVAVVGYSGDKAQPLIGKGMNRIVDLDAMNTPLKNIQLQRRLPSGAYCSTLVDRRQWITPEAKGRTPMGDALKVAKRLCTSWCRKHLESFPPIVINITDGEATDSSKEQIISLAESLKSVGTQDGNVLLMNIHIISEYDTPSESLRFPSVSDSLPVNRFAKLLYDISSQLPEIYNSPIKELRGGTPPYRAVCYNSSLGELFSLLSIGSLNSHQIL